MERRLTQNRLRLAAALMTDPAGRHWGYDLARQAHITPACAYPALGRMLADGWLTDHWEKSGTGSRPPRRYFKLTALGRRELGALAKEAHQDIRLSDLRSLMGQ